MSEEIGWGGHVSLGPGAVYYRGPGGDAEAHSHRAIQLLVSADGPFELHSGGQVVRTTAAVVASQARHALVCASARMEVALVEPDGAHAGRLAGLWGDGPIVDVAEHFPRATPRGLSGLLGQLAGNDVTPPPKPSPPALAAIAYIQATLPGMPRLAGAAEAAGLSASRLSHVFSAQAGLPFRRFVLWARLYRVVAEIADGSSLSDAAAAAGFSDAAHLSRTFKTHIGLPPSALLAMEIDDSAWRAGLRAHENVSVNVQDRSAPRP